MRACTQAIVSASDGEREKSLEISGIISFGRFATIPLCSISVRTFCTCVQHGVIICIIVMMIRHVSRSTPAHLANARTAP